MPVQALSPDQVDPRTPGLDSAGFDADLAGRLRRGRRLAAHLPVARVAGQDAAAREARDQGPRIRRPARGLRQHRRRGLCSLRGGGGSGAGGCQACEAQRSAARRGAEGARAVRRVHRAAAALPLDLVLCNCLAAGLRLLDHESAPRAPLRLHQAARRAPPALSEHPPHVGGLGAPVRADHLPHRHRGERGSLDDALPAAPDLVARQLRQHQGRACRLPHSLRELADCLRLHGHMGVLPGHSPDRAEGLSPNCQAHDAFQPCFASLPTSAPNALAEIAHAEAELA
mmetsp:Transcript_56847/g.169196  ORF Transcript_56847/g.169196 Transcript_56847/m.169196 type:complete len:285 (+) Transcript_56847:1712-2566(+)